MDERPLCPTCRSAMHRADDPTGTDGETGPDCRALRVRCDRDCGAPAHPVTLEEHRAALEHWMRHRLLAGCAHGC